MVSIIVPIYNIENYIDDCIQSVLKQTSNDYELILVDDGSIDASSQIIDKYARENTKIIPIHKHNGGLVSARKAGMRVASGEYIINIDGDDYVDPDLVETITQIANHNHPDIIAYGFKKISDDNGKILATQKFDDDKFYFGIEKEQLCADYLYSFKQKGFNDGCIPHCIWGKAVKRELYCTCQDKVPDDVTKGEDTLMTMLLLSKANNIFLSSYFGYCYRFRKGSMINSFSPNDFDKLEYLKITLLNIDSELDHIYQDRINFYILKRIVVLITNATKNLKNQKDFLDYACLSETAIDHLKFEGSNNFSNFSFKEKMLIRLILNKRWKMLFRIMKR